MYDKRTVYGESKQTVACLSFSTFIFGLIFVQIRTDSMSNANSSLRPVTCICSVLLRGCWSRQCNSRNDGHDLFVDDGFLGKFQASFYWHPEVCTTVYLKSSALSAKLCQQFAVTSCLERFAAINKKKQQQQRIEQVEPHTKLRLGNTYYILRF